jgi:choice-of-anchor C domain-containing protein
MVFAVQMASIFHYVKGGVLIMQVNPVKHLILILFCFCLVAGTAHANMITNGSFENGDYSGANWSWERLSSGDTRLTGWTIGGKGVDWHNTAEFKPSYNGSLSEHMIDLNLDGFNGSGTIAQTFATTAGKTYTVSFYMASPFSKGLAVTVDSFGGTFTQLYPGTPLTWRQHSFDFVADDNNATLMFSSLDSGSYWGAILDNIDVETANTNQPVVPEPSTALLVGAGLVGAALLRKKVRK